MGGMTIRAKTWLALALAGLVPLLLFSWFAFAVAYRGLTTRIDSQLVQQAAAERQTVTGFVSRNRERLRLVTSRTQLRLSLAAQLEAPAPEHVARIERILNDARNSIGSFRVLSVANEEGEIVASTNPDFRGHNLAKDPLFAHALEQNDACEFVLRDGALTKRLIGPLRLGGRRLGLAIIDLDASRLLDLTGDVNRLGDSARVYLSQRGVDGVVRHLNGDASRIVDAEGKPLVDRAFSGKTQLFEGAMEVTSNSEVPTMAATSYAAESRVAIIVKVSREEALAPARQLQQGAVFAALIAMACLVSAGVLLSRSITEPVRSLARAAAKMAKGDFKARALMRTAGEVETLRTEFNEMADHIAASSLELERRVAERTAELRAAQLQLIQAEKLESMGRLSAGVAHEIKNPLNTLQACVDYYKLKEPDDEDEIFTIETMEESIQRATRIVRGMLDYSRDEQLKMEIKSINDVIQNALELLQPDALRAKIEFVLDLGADLPPVEIDTMKIEQVLVNLLMNAMHASEEGDKIEVRSYAGKAANLITDEGRRTLEHLRSGDFVVVAEVRDYGSGIPTEKLTKIFDPFFTTKATGKGTGLGLSVSKTIVDLHDGMLSIRNVEPKGVCAQILLQSSSAAKDRPTE